METPVIHITRRLSPIYGDSEARCMADLLLEHITAVSRLEIRQLKSESLNAEQVKKLEECLQQLERHRPIQYVLGEAWFQEMPFYVDERVLIPRPETEELVEWVVQDFRKSGGPGSQTVVLDIGSGSGCIPISIRKKLPTAEIHSCDQSEDALAVAKINAERLKAEVHWHQLNFLDESTWEQLPSCDCIVSNPPYIPRRGAVDMSRHVVEFEPDMALFVPDEDPYVFYDAIARFAIQKAKPGAGIFVEIHESHAPGVRNVFEKRGLINIEVRLDMQGKDRMIKAIRP